MTIFELKQNREEELTKAEAFLNASERENRAMTAHETQLYNKALAGVTSLTTQIEAHEKRSTLRSQFPGGRVIPGGHGEGRPFGKPDTTPLSADYPNQFFEYVQSNGKKIGAALYEGSNPGGGFAVPVIVDNQIVPLAPTEMSVRRLAMVMPTSSDIKIPQKGAFSVATSKAENAAFTESDPVLSQITLSAFVAGTQQTLSWELAQDVPAFQAFCINDMIFAQQIYEEQKYISGTGTGQAQGLIGNVGAGPTAAALSLNGILDLVGSLNAVYHANASFLMQRATAIAIRKLQATANLYTPFFTRVGTQDYLLNYPLEYATAMPAAGTPGNKPILFGDFKQGYVIGDRGGSGINIKILDQPAAQLGQIILLAYRRTDGRVRRSEAIQTYTLA